MATPKLAPALITLREQVSDLWPGRLTTSDGWIGDEHHQARHSDHNPNGQGFVCAIDVTSGYRNASGDCIARWLWGSLATLPDERLGYMIHSKLIMAGNNGPSPWITRLYRGANPHTTHIHVSVRQISGLWEDASTWHLLAVDRFAPTVVS